MLRKGVVVLSQMKKNNLWESEFNLVGRFGVSQRHLHPQTQTNPKWGKKCFFSICRIKICSSFFFNTFLDFFLHFLLDAHPSSTVITFFLTLLGSSTSICHTSLTTYSMSECLSSNPDILNLKPLIWFQQSHIEQHCFMEMN